MIKLGDRPSGLSFKDWVLALPRIPDNTVIGNFFLDDHLTKYQQHWLQWMLFPRPREIKDARGIGNWKNPKIVILIEKIIQYYRPDKPEWNIIPEARLLHPFNSSGVQLRQFNLLTSNILPSHSYISAITKNWVNEESAYYLFLAEFSILYKNKINLILCIGSRVEFLMKKFIEFNEDIFKELKIRQIILPNKRWEWAAFHENLRGMYEETTGNSEIFTEECLP